MIKVSTSCKMLILDLTRAEIQLSLSTNGKIGIFDPKRKLTQRNRRRIAANHDELVAHLREAEASIRKDRVARIKPKSPDLLMVIPCGDTLVARAFGDGQPREAPTMTIEKFTMPPKRITRKPVIVSGPRAA
jgi:hypothetical protein